MNRREFLGLSALAASAVAAVSLGVTSEVVIDERTLPLKNLHKDLDGYRIGFISDIHLSGVTSPGLIQNVFQTVLQRRIDLLLLGGDYTWIPATSLGISTFNSKESIYNTLAQDELPKALHSDFNQILLKNIPEDGIIGVLGNHDLRMHPTECLNAFSNHKKIFLLRNQIKTIRRGNGSISIAGVEDYLTSTPELPKDIPQNHPSLLLAHNPDYASELLGQNRFPFSGALCGHTHGGQIRVPGFGPIALNISDPRFTEGLVPVNNTFVFTTRGIGVVGIPFRINCPPEAHIFTIVQA